MSKSFETYYVKGRVRVKLVSNPKQEDSSVLWSLNEDKEYANKLLSYENPVLTVNPLNFEENSEQSPNPEPPDPPDPPSPEPAKGSIADGYFYVGVRLKKTIYESKKFRNAIGLYIKEDLSIADRKVSIKNIRKANDSISLGFFSTVYATFVAIDASSTYNYWGLRHRTYIMYDTNLRNEKLADILYNFDFEIGPSKNRYKIELDSIKTRSSRKSVLSL